MTVCECPAAPPPPSALQIRRIHFIIHKNKLYTQNRTSYYNNFSFGTEPSTRGKWCFTVSTFLQAHTAPAKYIFTSNGLRKYPLYGMRSWDAAAYWRIFVCRCRVSIVPYMDDSNRIECVWSDCCLLLVVVCGAFLSAPRTFFFVSFFSFCARARKKSNIFSTHSFIEFFFARLDSVGIPWFMSILHPFISSFK